MRCRVGASSAGRPPRTGTGVSSAGPAPRPAPAGGSESRRRSRAARATGTAPARAAPLTCVQDEVPPVPVQRLRDRGHDQPEVVGEYIRTAYTAPATGFAVPPRGPGSAQAEPSTARSTNRRVSGATLPCWLSTRDTVAIETPVAAATSRTVARSLGICYIALFHAQHSNATLPDLDRGGRRAFPVAVCFIRGAAMKAQAIGVALVLATARWSRRPGPSPVAAGPGVGHDARPGRAAARTDAGHLPAGSE